MTTRFFVVGLTIVLSIGLIIQGCGTKEEDTAKSPAEAASTSNDAENSGRDSVTITLIGQDSVTVYQLLQMSHYVEARETSMGTFVTGIDSVRGGSVGFWVYSVNDTVPKIAADKMFTRAGDTVVWKLKLQSE